MSQTKNISILCTLFVLLCFVTHTAEAQQRRRPRTNPEAAPAESAPASGEVSDEALKAELDAFVNLPPAERIGKLKAFIGDHPQSTLRTRGMELLASAHAALGDEKLQAGDAAGGTEQFRFAIAASPAEMSDRLFAGVISQLPSNLFLRGEPARAVEIARLVEAKVKDDPKRLINLAVFYLGSEEADEAARIAEAVIKLAPDTALAYQALGAARRIALRLDEAAAAYARALELDPQSAGSRLGLADLRRADGKSEEALALYREGLKANAAEKGARAGVVLSLFDLGRKDEASRELEAALQEDPRNLALLVGAGYWYVGHDEGARALEMASRAVEIEPRYTWAQIALARALVAQKRPLDAERALRFARQFGQFPTLDYELATVLASAGLYGEAASELARSFKLRDGQIETRLAGRTPARAADFIELLAPERRASIFQRAAADKESDARMLKALLAFNAAINPARAASLGIKEREAIGAAQEFIAGDDGMRAYRQLYVASRLLKNNVALPTVLELTEAAAGGLEAALDAPSAPVAVWADELRDVRASATAAGSPLTVVNFDRNVLSNVLRGRIEDLSGWALYNQDKMNEAVTRLRRAVSILPENHTLWRTAVWHLGAALDAGGNGPEALAAYLRSYRSGPPDPARRAVIQVLYRKINGTLDGFDAALSAKSIPATSTKENATAAATTTPPPPIASTPTPTTGTTTAEAQSGEVDAQIADRRPAPDSAPPLTPSEPLPSTGSTIEPQNTEMDTATAVSGEPLPAATPAQAVEVVARQKQSGDNCAISLNESLLKIRRNGGSASVTVSLDGQPGAPLKVTPTTSDWPDIAVFAEAGTEGGASRYSITSISKRSGTYAVSFNSPCGSKVVTVTVE